MKTFIEEYGVTVVIAIILTMLIGVAVIFRTQGKNSILAVVDNFQNTAEISTGEQFGGPTAPVVKTATLSGRLNITYEEGMTWGEWCNSEYNPHNAWFVYYDEVMDYAGSRIEGSGPDVVITGNETFVEFCFVAGTQVTYDLEGHTKNIEDFMPGDDVVSYNLDTKEFYLAKVVDVTRHESKAELETTLAEVTFDNGATLNLTLDHEMLTINGGKSVKNISHPERELKIGDIVVTKDGFAKVTYINVYNCEPTPTYCLCVMDEDEIASDIDDDSNDNFLAEGIVVHNAPNEPGPYPGQIPEPSPYPEPEPIPEPNPYMFQW